MPKRDVAKLKKVLAQKGYSKGKLPQGKVAHHVKSISEGGPTTKKNIRVVSKQKHIQIHKNRAKAGRV